MMPYKIAPKWVVIKMIKIGVSEMTDSFNPLRFSITRKLTPAIAKGSLYGCHSNAKN